MADKKITNVTSVDSLINGDKIFINQNASLKQINLGDIVVEQGVDGIWTWRKWASGIAECWGTTSSDYAITEVYGGEYYCANYLDLPLGIFTSVDSITGGRAGGATTTSLATVTINVVSTSYLRYYVHNPSSVTVSLNVSFDIKGRWK